jgi:hypothetical protein
MSGWTVPGGESFKCRHTLKPVYARCFFQASSGQTKRVVYWPNLAVNDWISMLMIHLLRYQNVYLVA